MLTLDVEDDMYSLGGRERYVKIREQWMSFETLLQLKSKRREKIYTNILKGVYKNVHAPRRLFQITPRHFTNNS